VNKYNLIPLISLIIILSLGHYYMGHEHIFLIIITLFGLAGAINAIVTWYKRRVTPLFKGPEMVITKELWFRDLNLSPEPIKGIYECQIDRPDYTVDQYLVWVDQLPNGTPYCGHEWVRIVDILGYEEPVEEEGPCLRCGGSGYITVGEVVIDGALEQKFEDCEPECIKRQEDESAAWSRMIYARALTRWSCVHCKKLVRDCKCTDIPF
jgi:hypothetical protein